MRGLVGERIRQGFRVYEKDGDGFIDHEDVDPVTVDRYDSQSNPPPTKAIEIKKPDGGCAVRRGSNQGSANSSRVRTIGSPPRKEKCFSATKTEGPVGTPSRRQVWIRAPPQG